MGKKWDASGVAYKKLGRHFIGIEREEDYIKIAEARMGAVKDMQMELIKDKTSEISK